MRVQWVIHLADPTTGENIDTVIADKGIGYQSTLSVALIETAQVLDALPFPAVIDTLSTIADGRNLVMERFAAVN